MYEIIVLREGMCTQIEDDYVFTCTCVLIKGKYNAIVNTMSPWDGSGVLEGVEKEGLAPNDINYVISTHARPDFCGGNHLFKNSTHVVGHTISKKSRYFKSPLSIGNAYYIDKEYLKVIPTPGYTLTDTTVVVATMDGVYHITGELFQDEVDLGCKESSKQNIFTSRRRIEYPICWRFNRKWVMEEAEYIIPGHGEPFKVTDQMRRDFYAVDNDFYKERRRMKRKRSGNGDDNEE